MDTSSLMFQMTTSKFGFQGVITNYPLAIIIQFLSTQDDDESYLSELPKSIPHTPYEIEKLEDCFHITRFEEPSLSKSLKRGFNSRFGQKKLHPVFAPYVSAPLHLPV